MCVVKWPTLSCSLLAVFLFVSCWELSPVLGGSLSDLSYMVVTGEGVAETNTCFGRAPKRAEC